MGQHDYLEHTIWTTEFALVVTPGVFPLVGGFPPLIRIFKADCWGFPPFLRWKPPGGFPLFSWNPRGVSPFSANSVVHTVL